MGRELVNKKRYLVIVGFVVAASLLSILFYTMLANHRPVITSLEAERETVLLSRSCQIVCNATDRDNDELSYTWSASGGGITGEGAMVAWTAPDSAGSYTITATVTDDHGASVTKQVTVTARDNKPPTINSLTGDADWTTPSGKVQVTCNAADPDGDELTYAWLTDEGDISGTGAAVTWTAPEAGNHFVMVMITDGYGGSAMSWVGINVGPPIQAANTELHQAQTAIIAAMAEAESDNITWSTPPNNPHGLTANWWAGEAECVQVLGTDGTTWYDAADYCYGPFRAAYFIETADTDPEHLGWITNGNPLLSGGGGWGSSIVWNPAYNNWNSVG